VTRKLTRRSAEVTDPAARDAQGASEEPAAPGRTPPPDPDGTVTDPTGDQAGADEAGADEKARRSRRSRGALALVLAALVVLALVPVFVARIYVIPSGSMDTTLHGCPGCDNDRVLVDKLSYRFGAPEPGDIVVFTLPATWTSTELRFPHGGANPVVDALRRFGALVGLQTADETVYIKRVIAVGGQTVACCDERNRLLVDGVPRDEPYLYFQPEAGPLRQEPFGPVRVPEGRLWVMGDSRNDSVDSRAAGNGPVPLADVIGKARFIVWPFDRIGGLADPAAPTP
jgi:signal peptidase I